MTTSAAESLDGERALPQAWFDMTMQQCFEISQASDLESFRSLLIKGAGNLGFELVTTLLVIENPRDGSQHVRAVNNTPTGYLEASFDPELIKRDPVSKRLRRLSVPFCYDQALYVQEGAGDMWEEQAAYGYKCGIAAAFHLPDHRHFLFGVDRHDRLPENLDRRAQLMADLQFLAVHALAGASRLLLPTPTLAELPHLSEQQKEVLRWTQEGKSNWVIGQIMGLSEDGVRYHLRSICRKLDATSKPHALQKARHLGLL